MFRKYQRSGLLLMALPLYAGPVLAGWMQAPVALPVALVAVFFLAQLLAGKTALRGAIPMPAFLLMLGVAQIGVVAVAWGAGRVLAELIGAIDLPLWLPLMLTGGGATILVHRYGHDPDEDQMLSDLDAAIHQIETGQAAPSADTDVTPATADDIDATQAVSDALETLWSLPADTPVAQLDTVVHALEARVGPYGFFGLLGEIDEGFAQVDRAMLRYLSSPSVRAALIEAEEIGVPLTLLASSDDPATQHELAQVIQTLLDEGVPADQLPDPNDLQSCPALQPLAEPVAQARRMAGLS